MSLDPRYIAATDLSGYLVDKDTGLAIMNGWIEFWVDTQRNTPKLVYKLSGQAPNYTFEALPNPIQVVNGTAVDNTGANIAIYYFPYASSDEDAALQLYYVAVKSVNPFYTQNLQFVREAWPPLPSSESANVSADTTFVNQIENGQFVDVNFDPSATLTIAYSGAVTTVTEIAPGWTLTIVSSGAGNTTVVRNAIAGNSDLPGNPPYTLTITPVSGVQSATLSQRMLNNPSIWSPGASDGNGYVSTNILLANNTSVLVQYAPSDGTTQLLLQEDNTTGQVAQFSNVIQLIAPDNANNANVGYVDILIKLDAILASTISNVQLVSMGSNVAAIPYQQQSANLQKAALFNYYNPKLQYKPIPSYLVGWDFHLNPTQFFGSTLAAQAVGANKSYYAWDQTIVFQSADSAFLTRRAITGNGSLELDATTTSQCAIIQYLPQATARAILNDRISVALSVLTNHTGGLVGTVSLWYTKDGSLPSLGATNNSIVATLNATGGVATQNGTWIEVPRGNLGAAKFTVANSVTNNFDKHTFSGWDMQGVADTNLATYFAIVVGFASMVSTDVIDFDSVSLVAGDIATEPSPQTPAAVLLDCQQFYTKSFLQGTTPINSAGVNTSEYIFTAGKAGALTSYSSSVLLPTTMNVTPTVTLYSVAGTSGQAYDETAAAACSGTGTSLLSNKAFSLATVGNASTAVGNQIGVHWTADARLGK